MLGKYRDHCIHQHTVGMLLFLDVRAHIGCILGSLAKCKLLNKIPVWPDGPKIKMQGDH